MKASSHIELTITFQGSEEIRLFRRLCEGLRPGGSKDVPHLTTDIAYDPEGIKIQKLTQELIRLSTS